MQFVSPYIGIQNQPGTLIARGSCFTSAGPGVTVMVGTDAIGPLAPDSDTQITIPYPALPAGTYPVSVQGVTGSSADLVVLALPSISQAFIHAPSTRQRLVYDAERQTLYAVNQTDQEIERYTYAAGAWTALLPYVLPEVTDIGLAPNGKSLIVSTHGGMDDIQLGSPSFVAVQRWGASAYLAHLAILDDGKAFVVTDCWQCSGFTESYLYDFVTYTGTQGPYPQSLLYDGIVAASLDGSRAYAGSNGVSPAQGVDIFDALTDTFSSGFGNGNAAYNLFAVTVSGDASRVILQDSAVYSRDLTLTGNLATGGVALASRDSTKAFLYKQSAGGQASLVVYDLTGALLPGAIYPTLATIPLATSPNSASGSLYDITMASTPDDAVVFVSGDSGIAVVPVP